MEVLDLEFMNSLKPLDLFHMIHVYHMKLVQQTMLMVIVHMVITLANQLTFADLVVHLLPMAENVLALLNSQMQVLQSLVKSQQMQLLLRQRSLHVVRLHVILTHVQFQITLVVFLMIVLKAQILLTLFQLLVGELMLIVVNIGLLETLGDNFGEKWDFSELKQEKIF